MAFGLPWRFNRLLNKFERSSLVPGLAGKGFQHFSFVIDRTPEIVHLAVILHADLVEVPSPVHMSPHPIDTLLGDLGGEHRTKSVPPQPHRLVTNVDAAFS